MASLSIGYVIMTISVPAEFQLSGIFMPPLLVAGFFGVCASVLTAKLLNRFRLSRYFFYPPVVFVALSVIYTVAFGRFVPW